MTIGRSPLYILLFNCLLFVVLPLSATGAGTENEVSPTKQTIERLHQHLDGLASLNFQFTQQTSGQMSGRPRQASGEAFFFKDRNTTKMRWDYSAPDKQVIISDGITLTMYFEQMQQMIITPAESLQQDVTFSFFTGRSNIEEEFLLQPELDENTLSSLPQGIEVVTLIPRAPTSQVKTIRLWITGSTQIQRIEIVDNFDTLTLLNLSNIEENSLVTDDQLNHPELFTFTPPPGTEIIHQ